MMIDHHTKAGEQLKSIASMHSIQVPTDVDDTHRQLRDKLTNLKVQRSIANTRRGRRA